jgi:hypothetical protein
MALSKKIVQLIIFFIIANPVMYKITSKLPVIGGRVADSTGRPTQFGVFVHALVFVLVSMLAMKMTSNK